MYLPDRENAIVSKAKVNNYLLSLLYPIGKHKARFFTGIGFEIAEPEKLIKSLKQLAVKSPVANVEDTYFGTKYTIEGIIEAPNTRSYLLRTVWMTEN